MAPAEARIGKPESNVGELRQTQAVPTEPRDLLRVDEPMRRFLAERVAVKSSDEQRLRELVDALVRPEGLNFVYDAAATLDAPQACRLRRGNCVSFAFLVVAMARELGFTATFQNVDVETRWNRFGQIVASVQHLDVRVDCAFTSFLVDVRPDLVPRESVGRIRAISDARACAEFYSTYGVFELVAGRKLEAIRYLTRASEIDPECAEAWTNLGSFYNGEGQPARAQACFERALREDPDDVVALLGLVELLRQVGTPEAVRRADKLDRHAEFFRRRDPYYQEFLALRAQRSGDLASADKLLRRAIALKDDDPEFYLHRVDVLRQLGREADAQRVQRELERLQNRLAAMSPHIGG